MLLRRMGKVSPHTTQATGPQLVLSVRIHVVQWETHEAAKEATKRQVNAMRTFPAVGSLGYALDTDPTTI